MMGKLPHEELGWESISNGSWKKSSSYKPPHHWSRKLMCFLGIHLYMHHIFDIRELFVRVEDFAGGFNFPSYKQCFRRFRGLE